MFQALISPPSGVCNYGVELPHCRLKHNSVLLQLAAWIPPLLNCTLTPATEIQEQYRQCGSSTTQSEIPEGHINA